MGRYVELVCEHRIPLLAGGSLLTAETLTFLLCNAYCKKQQFGLSSK
jgi:hypothetical protein